MNSVKEKTGNFEIFWLRDRQNRRPRKDNYFELSRMK